MSSLLENSDNWIHVVDETLGEQRIVDEDWGSEYFRHQTTQEQQEVASADHVVNIRSESCYQFCL